MEFKCQPHILKQKLWGSLQVSQRIILACDTEVASEGHPMGLLALTGVSPNNHHPMIHQGEGAPCMTSWFQPGLQSSSSYATSLSYSQWLTEASSPAC